MRSIMKMLTASAVLFVAFIAFADPSAKAVLEDNGTTLRFVYDEENYGTKDVKWFSVAEAEAIPAEDNVPWYGNAAAIEKVVFDRSFAAYRPKRCCKWFMAFAKATEFSFSGNLEYFGSDGHVSDVRLLRLAYRNLSHGF